MDRCRTPILTNATPPESPERSNSFGSARSPQSVMGSPYSLASVGRSPQMRSPQLQSPHARSPAQFRSEVPDLQKPRLIIRKLVLINYKSYAGRQEVGPFNENFTAVVGPNGSGKSNIIDSLLFVFGFRAKKMRQDKLSGLIHKSEEFPALPFARVEAHFETVGVPDSTLVLAREVRRDGNNFYSLNDKRCTYGEVSELLEERGIDLRHKRFLILQGEVESIALMPPKAENDGDDGLLEYLEDIIGTSNYKSRIEELEQQTDTLLADSDEKQRRVDIVFKDLRKLDEERAEVEKFMVDQNRGTVARSQLWQLYLSRAQSAIQLSKEGLDMQEKAIESIESRMAEEKTRLGQLEAEANSSTDEANSLKAELKKVTKTLKESQLKLVKLNQRKDQLQAKKKKCERDLSHARNEKKSAELWLQNFEDDSKGLQLKLKNVIAAEVVERKKLEAIQAELHESTKDLHDELESLQIQAEPWREKISAKKQELKALEAEYNSLKNKLESAQQREKGCRAEAESVITEGHAAQKQVKHLTKSYNALVKEREDIETEIEEALERKTALKDALEQLKPEVVAAQEARASSQNRNRLESELMRLKIPGLFGRLGSLGSIDEKYDIAISTAGPELNNFVVDTVETAKKCIDELRKRSIGRAKFMVLSKLKPVRNTNEQFPAQRLLDLIKPVDPLFMKAFASVLGDTLVVSTPEEATKVAFGGAKRFKVVTLGGMLVNSSGQMGGGGAPSRGLMAKSATVVSSEELEALEKRLAAASIDYADAKETHQRLTTQKEELSASIPRRQVELEKERMSLKELEAQMQRIRESRRKLQNEVQEQQTSVDQFAKIYEAEKNKIENECANLESQSQSIEASIQKIQSQILEAGGIVLREQSVKVSDLKKEQADIQRQLEEGQEKVAQESSRLTKAENELNRLTKEIQEAETGDISYEEVGDIGMLEAKSQELAANLDNCVNKAEEAKSMMSSVRADVEVLRAEEIEARNTYTKIQKSLKESVDKRNDLQNKLKQLKLHDVSIARSLDANTFSANTAESDSSDTEPNQPPNVPSRETSQPMTPDSEMLRCENQGLAELTPDELEDIDESNLKSIIVASDEACKSSKVDFEVLQRYRSRFSEYVDRKRVGDEAVSAYENARNEVQLLKKRRHTEFMNGFLQISSKLKEMYQLITIGGNAELELVDSMDPFAEGILFSVMPPKKSWRNIANLSGGEKTLSSLALVFALHHYKPTPLYVMDEIDAALDFRNVSIIANYIKERTKNGQFIVISLRNNMFELASRLVGVYKVENKTKSVALQID